MNRIDKQSDLMERYDAIIQDQLQSGIIEKVDRDVCDGMKHCIPHNVVTKPDKATTKHRIVYDASANASKNHHSLN